MATEKPDGKNELTIYLPEEVAQRLALAAAKQHRTASEIVAQLLDRHLPQLETRGKKQKKIPYA